MRPWLWEFMAWTAREWNQVQDAWWFNFTALPKTGSNPNGLRDSLKACVWLGAPDCYRVAKDVLWAESDVSRAKRLSGRMRNDIAPRPCGRSQRDQRSYAAAAANGGVTPFNVILASNGEDHDGHGAGTSRVVADWWTRYISPPGGTVLDPFCGSGTMALAALELGRSFVGIEKFRKHYKLSCKRIKETYSILYPPLRLPSPAEVDDI